ncbi:hypothetical protein LCGC14_1985470 [marine sediment metagenome]|uniref:Uncharacterized protein n=1 Tax=marine sediment metagenome TaxID=412755 RepID=A0A0F9I4R1_9ZZZZ
MKLQIVIPTYKRIKKLDRCLHSILASSYQNFKVLVIADNKDSETRDFIWHLNHPKIECIVNLDHLYVAGSWNRFFKEYYNKRWDIAIWLVDDIALYPDCLEKAVECFEIIFQI